MRMVTPVQLAAFNHIACTVCGSTAERRPGAVLWPELITDWGLSDAEAALVDLREGATCEDCGCSMRNQALAEAIVAAAGASGTLASWVATAPALRVLEVNTAGTLTPWLRQLSGHRLVEFPEVDLQSLPFEDGTWDLVVHSETVEHVADPVLALAECRRVLAPGGSCAFSAPVIPGRLTRRRDGLKPSYHGLESDPAYLVVSEFGADFWTVALDAGFTALTTVRALWPVSVAYIAAR